MSEYPSDPERLDDGTANWAFDPNTLTDTIGAVPSVPDAARRLNGFATGETSDEPAPEHVNFALREALKAALHLHRRTPRQFTTLAEGIAATSPGNLFFVRSVSPRERLALTETEGPSGATITAIDTDGQYVFFADTDGFVHCVAKVDPGTAIWSVDLESGKVPYLVAADGAHVFVGFASGLATKTYYILDHTDGSVVSSTLTDPPTAGVGRIASNGVKVAFIRANDERDLVVADADDLLTSTTHADHWGASGGQTDLCITANRIISCGSNNGGDKHVICWDLGGNVKWSFGVTTTTASPNAIATDGDLVFFGTDGTTHDGVAANLFCLALGTGELVWTADVGSSLDVQSVAVDDTYVLAADDSGNLALIDKRTGAIVEYRTGGGSVTPTKRLICTDGQDWITANGGSVHVLSRAVPSRLYQRVAGTDQHRRPFHTLAVPLAGL